MMKQFSKLLPLLAITGGIFICSCGNSDTIEGNNQQQKDDTCPKGFTGDLCDKCLPGYWGEDCQACNRSGPGKCNEGLTGDGSCTCDKGWNGQNCSTESSCPQGFGGKDGTDCNSCLDGYYGNLCKPCDCKHGVCQDGKSSNGQCKGDCDKGWSGNNCDDCADGYATKSCVLANCKNGTPKLGLEGDGHCSKCIDDWSGTDCDIEPACNTSNGKPNFGVEGNGHCSSCNDSWTGTDCDVCPAGFYDGVNNCFDCTKGVEGSYFGKDECTYADTRDSSSKVIYPVVKIGNQLWMAENLKADMDINGNHVNCWADTKTDSNFVKNYGCLYTWKELATQNGVTNEENTNRICPKGWHLPSKDEFNQLEDNTAPSSIRSSSWYWGDINGSDSTGFGAVPAGYKAPNTQYYDKLGSETTFWSSTKSFKNDTEAYYFTVDHEKVGIYKDKIEYGYSVRCIKDSKQK